MDLSLHNKPSNSLGIREVMHNPNVNVIGLKAYPSNVQIPFYKKMCVTVVYIWVKRIKHVNSLCQRKNRETYACGDLDKI